MGRSWVARAARHDADVVAQRTASEVMPGRDGRARRPIGRRRREPPAVSGSVPGRSVRSVVLRFALAGLVALVVVAVGTAFVSRRTGTREAIDDARRLSVAAATGIIEPNLTD